MLLCWADVSCSAVSWIATATIHLLVAYDAMRASSFGLA